jgi:hypothetical protein
MITPADALLVAPVAAGPASSGPDRTIPQQLIDVAVLAIKAGAHRVSLAHESLGADFAAPIGWLLRVHQHDSIITSPEERAQNTTLITHQVGCDMDDVQAPAWVTKVIESDAPEAVVLDELLELFQAAIRNGWDVAYERHVFEHFSWQETVKRHGMDDSLGMRHSLKATAFNWGYDDADRERDDALSIELSLSMREGATEDTVAGVIDVAGYQPVEQTYVDTLLRATAPWFVPVAYVDDELEDWVK